MTDDTRYRIYNHSYTQAYERYVIREKRGHEQRDRCDTATMAECDCHGYYKIKCKKTEIEYYKSLEVKDDTEIGTE